MWPWAKHWTSTNSEHIVLQSICPVIKVVFSLNKVPETQTKEKLQNLSYINNLISHSTHESLKKKGKKRIVHELKKQNQAAYIYACEHGCTVEREKTSTRKGRGRKGGEAEKKKREGARLAQWVLLVSQWQCQGSWQGPDARHQLQRLVNRLLSRRHICTAMVAHTRTHTDTHRHVGTCIYYGRHTDRHWLIVSPKSCKRDSEPLCALCPVKAPVKRKCTSHTGTPNSTKSQLK